VNISVSFYGITQESRPRLRALIEERAHRLERHYLTSFQPELVRVEGRVEKNPSHHLYRVALRLKLPSGVLVAAAENHGLQKALKEVFEELDRRTERHVARLQRAHLWRRVARRHRLEKLKHGVPGGRDREERRLLCELIQPHLDEIYGYLHREILYLETIGDVRAGTLEPADIVAGALLRALERFSQRPHRMEVKEWLLALAHEEIAAALREEPIAQSLDAAQEPQAEEPTAREEELYEFWEPEERLKLEDLLPDPTADDPEQAVELRDVRRALVRALAALPRAWRQAVMLTTFEGLSSAQAGKVLGRSEEELEEVLRHAHAFLEARAKEAGFEYEPKGMGIASLSDLGRVPLPPEERSEILKALAE